MEQITLDLIPSGILPVVHASQYDEGRQWRVNLTDNGTAYTLSTEEITLKVRKGDGTAVTTAVTVVSGKTYVDLATTEQMTAVAFENMAELHIEKDGAHIGTLNFIIKVEPDNLYGDVKSHTEIHDLAHQVDECVTRELKTVGAKLTGYDNTESGLTATNVQDAIDELASQPSVDAYTKQESDEKYATKTELSAKADVSAIPTKTSDLQNDSGFAQIDDTEASASKTYSSEKIEQFVGTTARIDDTSTANNKVWSAEKTNSELNGVKGDITSISEYVPSYYSEGKKTTNDNYWQVRDNYPYMIAGHKYRWGIVTNTTFTETSIQIGTGASAASMVDTVAENISFTAGEEKFIDYIPSESNLKYIRVIGNAGKYSKMTFYELNIEPKGVTQAEKDIVELQADSISLGDNCGIAVKTNKAISDLRELKNKVDESIDSLLQLQADTATTQTITIPSVGEHDRFLLRLGLHYESSSYTPEDNDVFFGKTCRKDFSDVKFFDSNGNMIKAEFSPVINCDILADSSLDNVYVVTSAGYLIGFKTTQGMLISKNNGASFSVIPNTYNVTVHPSDVYNLTSIFPVFVDSNDNIFGYAGGILYKLSSSDDYATITPVLDFSWVNSNNETVYPEIQKHGMDEDINGNLYMGSYASTQYKHVDIFASSDGGNTWSKVFYDYSGDYQHTHHIHADKYSSKVYIGIDDGGGSRYGAKIIMTDDGGSTFTNFGEQYPDIRAKDYYPTYFGSDYMLGGGESYVMGGGTILRSGYGNSLDVIVKGFGGVRTYADFGNDDVIFAGVQINRLVTENHILVSSDKGKTWKSVYKKYQPVNASSGAGFRVMQYAGTLAGDTEPCIISAKDQADVPSIRIYKGGEHFYREAYLYLENVQDAPLTITVKTGYAMGYPYKCLEENKNAGLVYSLPLNEATGRNVVDSRGNIGTIIGGYEWWHEEEPIRYGDGYGTNTRHPFVPSTGIRLGENAYLDMGKITGLDFSKNYTIEFWFNMDKLYLSDYGWEKRDHLVVDFFDIGNVRACMRSAAILLLDSGADLSPVMPSINDISRMGMTGQVPFKFSSDWIHCVLSVDNDNVMKVYTNGCVGSTQNAKAGTWLNLSAGNLVIGATGYSKAYIAGLNIYNYAMNDEQVLNQYRGLN